MRRAIRFRAVAVWACMLSASSAQGQTTVEADVAVAVEAEPAGAAAETSTEVDTADAEAETVAVAVEAVAVEADAVPAEADPAAVETDAVAADANTDTDTGMMEATGPGPPEGLPEGATYTRTVTGSGLIRGWSWDLQLTGGAGRAIKSSRPRFGMGRLRAGALFTVDYRAIFFGATFDVGGLTQLGGGLEVELMDIQRGVSLRAGAAIGEAGRIVSHLSLGYTLVGLEWQRRFLSDGVREDAFYVLLNLPIGIVTYYLQQNN